MRPIPGGTLFCVMLSACLFADPAAAASNSYNLTVRAGKHDRTNTPVVVLLRESETQANLNPVTLAKAQSVKLTDAAGNCLAAQLTAPGLLAESAATGGVVVRQLHFILPCLKKGQSLELVAAVSTDAERAEGFAWKDTPGEHSELSFATRPVLRYVYKGYEAAKKEGDKHFKVYHHLYDPAGTRFVTKGEPTGLYPHHRGLFFGFSRISYGDGKRVNTWGCEGDHHQSHEKFLAEEVGPVLGRHAVAVDWHGQGKEVFAAERRELTVYSLPGGLLVEFASRLSSTVGKVKLDGDPQHAGFQFRAAEEVAAKNQKLTYYLRPDGKGAPGETRNWSHKDPRADCVNLPWKAMSFVLCDKRYTAVYVDKPTNPKEARHSERPYGRFGSYFEYELDEGKDLAINYRLWLRDGEVTADEAAALSADFVDPPQVDVK